MHHVEIFIILLSIIAILRVLVDKIKIPYPILLVLVGLAISLIPGLPNIELSPDVVFLIFLPPLLYSSAWTISWHDFKAAKRPIGLLSTGLVLFTTTAVAGVAHYFIPGFTWPLAFVLGAIISPPDAVAAASVTKGLGVPKRILTILEGESLVNDASGLIAYRYAVAAVLTGNFVFWEAGLQFVVVAVAGTAVGLLIGYIMAWVHRHTPENPVVHTTLTLLSPYIAFLVAEKFHFSGVLAVVTTGLYLSWRSSEILSHQTRIKAVSVWETCDFLLNGIIFILIGLHLRTILVDIQNNSLIELISYGFLISFVVMIVRIIWVFPGAYLPRWLSQSIRQNEPSPHWKEVLIVSWTGMRGVVSLAAALALPVTMENGQPFPQRNMILFLSFSVILFTLIVQGISLPRIIRWLGIKPDDHSAHEEVTARVQLASAAIVYIEENFAFDKITQEALAQIKNKYEIRINHLRNISSSTKVNEEIIYDQFHKIQHDLLDVERKLVIQMRKDGAINDEVLRKLEFELDLEESRLSIEES